MAGSPTSRGGAEGRSGRAGRRRRQSVPERAARAIAAAEALEARRLLTAITFTGGSGNWNVASNWSPAQVPGGGDAVTIPAGATVDVTDGESALSTQAAAGSTIDISATGVLGAGTGTIAGTVNDADLFYGSGSASTPLVLAGTTNVTLQLNNSYFQNTGQLNLTGAGAVVLGAHVTNDGTVTVTGGANLDSGTFTNDAGHTIALADDTTTSGGTILNSGVIAKTAGTGASILTGGGVIEDYGGTISAESGTLTIGDQSFFQNTTFTAAAGAAVSLDQSQGTETGNAYFSGTVTGSGAGHLEFTSGTVNPGNPSTGGSTLTTFALNFPQGFAQVTGMTFRGNTPHLVNAGYLQFVGDAQHPALDIDNTGTIAVSGAGDLGFGNQTAFLNDTTGVIDLTSDAGLANANDGAGGSFYLTNKGLIEKTGGTGTSSIGTAGVDGAGSVGVGFEDEGGTISAQTGTLDFPAGGAFENTTFTAAAGATVSLDDADGTGNGVSYYLSGTLAGSGAGNLVFAGNGVATGGPYDGSFTPTTGAILNFPAGFAQVTGTIFQSGGATQIVNQAFLDYTGAAQHAGMGIDNKGTIDVTGTGNLGASSDGGFINDTTGVLDFQTDAGVTSVGGNTGFTNMGLIEKTGGTGDSVIGTGTAGGIGLVSAGGSYDVESGTLTLANGDGGFDFVAPAAPITTAPGTVFAIGGPAHVEGDPAITGGGTFEVTANGDLFGPGNDSYETNTTPAVLDFDSGTFIVAGGDLGDSTGLVNTGTINYEGAGELDGVDNKGVITFDAGPLRVAGNIVNEAGGLLDFTAAQQILAEGNNGIISNAGSAVFSPGAGNTFDLSQINAVNTGTFYITSGTLNLPWIPNQYVEDPGLFPNGTGGLAAGSTFVLDAGATATVDTTPTFTLLAGTLVLGGAGASFPAYAGLNTITGKLAVLSGDTFAVAGDLTNNGTLSVGGTVTVAGTYTQSAEQYVTSPPTPTLDFEVAAAAGAAGAPSLTVTGATTLAGDLTADYVDGFTGSGGAYTVATFAGGSSGSFASTAGTAPFFTPSVSAGGIVLNGTAFTGTGGSTPLPAAPTVSTPTPTPTPTPTSTPPDLEVSAVTAPATFAPGSQQTIAWTVTNVGTGAATGTWEDSVFLSADGVIDASSVLVGRATHTGPLAAGASYAGAMTAYMPPVVGAYTVLVEADSKGAVTDDVRTGDVAGSAAQTTAVVPALTLGTATAGTVALGQQLVYSLSAAALSDVSLAATFGVALAANLYVRASYLPTPALYDYAFASTTATAATDLLHASRATTFYVLVYGRVAGTTTPQAFTITPTAISYGPAAVSPDSGVNYGQTTVTVSGADFTPATMVNLVSNGQVAVSASSVTFVDANTLYATFQLTNAAVGDYDVQTTEGSAGPTASLPAAFHVTAVDTSGNGATAAAPGALLFSLSAPTYVRAGEAGTLTLSYENAGGSDIGAPIIDVTSDNASFRVVGETGPYVEDGIDLLGISSTGPAGLLAPGQSNSIQIQFVQNTTGAHVVSNFTAAVLDLSTPIDWKDTKQDLRPAGEPLPLWDRTFTNFLAAVGTTVGSYEAQLELDASYLGSIGDRTADVGRLEYYQLEQAGGFGQLGQEYALGAFGYGQADPYNLTLTTDAAGDVTVTDAGRTELFIPATGGGYTAEPGDTSTLTLSGTAYTLAAADGSLTVFNANGTVNYFQDAHGNRTTATETALTVSQPVEELKADGVTEETVTATYTANLVTSLTAADGDVTKLAYNGQGLCTSVTDPEARVTTYAYDADLDLVSIAAPAGTTTYGYDATGYHLPETVTAPDGTVATYTYDTDGRVTSASIDGTGTTAYAYDDVGNMTETDAAGDATTILRGEDGSVVAVDNALGQRESFTYDANTALTTVTEPDGTQTTLTYATGAGDASGGDVTSSTDADGNTQTATYGSTTGLALTRTDADGNLTSFTYDAAGDVLTDTDAAGAVQTDTYTTAGQLATATTAAGRGVTDTYNAQGLLVSQAFSDGTSATYTYDAHRNLLTATSAAGTESFTYDTADRLTKVAYPNGLSLSYAYNALGQLASETDQTGYVTDYDYDPAGQLEVVTDAAGNPLATYTYDAVGRLIRTDLGNGDATTETYNGLGRVVLLVNYGPANAVLSQFAYAYDAAGNVSSVTTEAGVTTYAYDADGQLIEAVLPGGRTLTYAYDAEGNRRSVTDSGAATTAYATNDLNQYTSAGATTYQYDADGNLTSSTDAGGTTTYAYDVEGWLTSIAGPTGTDTYTYDALGDRIATTVNGVTTEDLVDPAAGDVLGGEYAADGSVIAHYTYGQGLAGQTDAAGTTSYYDFDGSGNTVALTGATGAVVNAYSYLPFGQQLTATGSAHNPFTFDGKQGVINAGNGNYLTAARPYSSTLGRFTQRDPGGLAAGDSNLYRYADNDPVDYSDPTGHILGYAFNDFGSVAARVAENTYLQATADAEALAASTEAEGEVFVSTLETNAGGVFSEYGTFLADEGLATTFTSEATVVAGTQTLTGYATVSTGVAGELAIVPATVPAGSGALTTGVLSGGTTVTAGTLTVAAAPPALLYYAYKYNQENPNGTPVPEQEVVNTATYNRILRNPLIAAAIKDFTNTTGHPPDQQQINDIIQIYSHLDDTPNPNPATTQTQAVTSHDPNSLTGPAGYGAAGYVPAVTTLPYEVDFENAATATAPAQTVTVTQTLDANLDLSTFQLGQIGFGSTVVAVPAGLQTFSTTVSLSGTLEVEVSADLDAATRVVTWQFTSVDPTTGDAPANPEAGFLPPDDAAGDGEGFVDYTVSPFAGLATGTTIGAQAAIVFDTNAAIATPSVTNTIDAGAPTSTVAPLAATQARLAIPLTWAGSDDAGGSGIAYYTILVSVDGGAYTAWMVDTTATSGIYDAQPGHAYAFDSIATDHVGNDQAIPAAAQATTAVPAIARTITVSAGHPGKFTDAAGAAVVITIAGPGTGTLSFLTTGDGDPVSFTLTGTTAATRVSVVAKGKPGTLALADVSATGSLAAFTAPTADLIGSFSVTGTLGSLSLDNATDGPATVTVGGAGVATAFRFGALTDVTLTTAAAIKSLSVASWTDGPFDADAITAPSIGTLTVAGNFDPTLTLTGSGLDLRSATIRGAVTGGTWTLAGSADAISIRGSDAGSLTATAVRSLHVGGDLTGSTLDLTGTGAKAIDLASLTVTGSVDGSAITAGAGIGSVSVGGAVTGGTWTLAGPANTISIRGSDAGSLTASSVRSLHVGGSLTGSTLSLTATGTNAVDLTSLTVTGSVTDSAITAAAGIGAATVGGMSGSTLFAGVTAGTTGLPTAASELTAAAAIRSFNDVGRSPFAGSDIAADTIGSATLRDVTTDNGGTIFGVAGHAVGVFALDQPKAKPLRYAGKTLRGSLTTLGGDLRVELL